MQLVFSWAPKIAKSVRVNIGCPVERTDGRSVGGRRSVYGHVIAKFSGMGRFTKLWGSAHARAWSSAKNGNHASMRLLPHNRVNIFSHLFSVILAHTDLSHDYER